MADLGSTRHVNVDFTAAGADTDPTTVAVLVTAPDGTTTSPAPDHDGLGLYHVDVVLTQPGTWTVTWTGTGTVPIVVSTTIYVPGASSDGPCANWIEWAEMGEYMTTVPDAQGAMQDAVLAQATRTLWRRSCEQYGYCTITRARVTPACRHSYSWRAGYGYYPTGAWTLAPSCGCGSYPFIDLGPAPVRSIGGVWIDGVELDPSAYRVDDWRRLVRTDGLTWPPSSLLPDLGGLGTTEVTRTVGLEVPPEGKMACALLAAQYANETLGTCEPSANATQINREGVTITINPPDGDTGIVLVERWLSNYHCGGGAMFDPGARRSTARIGT